MSVYLKQLVNFSQSIEHSDDIQYICQNLTDSLTRHFKLPDSVVYLRNSSNKFKQIAASGDKHCPNKGIIEPLVLGCGEGVVGSVAEKCHSIRIADTRQCNNYIVDGQSRLSELAVPISYLGEVIGIIDAEHPQANFFSKNHQLLMESLSALIAPRIANIHARHHLRSSVHFFQQKSLQSFDVNPDNKRLQSSHDKSEANKIEFYQVDPCERDLSKVVTNPYLSEIDYKQAFIHLLKNFHSTKTWQTTSLLNSCLLLEINGSHSVKQKKLQLTRLIHEKIDAMKQLQPTLRWAEIIELRFVKQQRQQQCLADQMNMGFSTFRRHQTLALEYLSDEFWLMEHERQLNTI